MAREAPPIERRFASVLDAVRCTVEIQGTLEKGNDGEPERFRIGVNVRDVMVKDGDIFGDGVNVAASLESLVKGGEICVSRGVHDPLRHPPGMIFEDLGEQLVKNIAHPIRASRLRLGEAGSEEASAPEAVAKAVEVASAPPAIVELSAETEVALELAFWESVKDNNRREELEAYLEQHPNGHFAGLARARLSSPEMT